MVNLAFLHPRQSSNCHKGLALQLVSTHWDLIDTAKKVNNYLKENNSFHHFANVIIFYAQSLKQWSQTAREKKPVSAKQKG